MSDTITSKLFLFYCLPVETPRSCSTRCSGIEEALFISSVESPVISGFLSCSSCRFPLLIKYSMYTKFLRSTLLAFSRNSAETTDSILRRSSGDLSLAVRRNPLYNAKACLWIPDNFVRDAISSLSRNHQGRWTQGRGRSGLEVRGRTELGGGRGPSERRELGLRCGRPPASPPGGCGRSKEEAGHG